MRTRRTQLDTAQRFRRTGLNPALATLITAPRWVDDPSSPNPLATGVVHMPGRRGARTRPGSPAREPSRKVLLAAEPGLRAKELEGMLMDEGYQVTVVGDGFELLNAWTFPWLASGVQPFGVIVTDGPTLLLSAPETIHELRRFSGCRATWVTTVRGRSEDPLDLDEVVARVGVAFWRESLRKKPA